MLRERIELSHLPHQNGPSNQPPELPVIDWGRGLALYTAPCAGAGRVAGLKSFAVRCELRGWLAARWAAGSAELVARFPAVRGNSDVD